MMQKITFHIIERFADVPLHAQASSAYLNRDNWDDWGKYCTLFHLNIVDEYGKKHEIGQVKIGQRGLKPHAITKPGHREPNILSSFEQLDDNFFSVGQDDDYYANLSKLSQNIREVVLRGLRDVAWDEERWEWAKDELVMEESLLRSVTESTVKGQFRRMAHGLARVTPYNFTYSPPKSFNRDGTPPFTLEFNVNPESPIPTNVHVLIGRNGVGKTRILSLMTKALIAKDASARQSGKFKINEEQEDNGIFANVVSVSFNAFDNKDIELLTDRQSRPRSLSFFYIGLCDLNRKSKETPIKSKHPKMLAGEYVKSLKECHIGARRERWLDIIATLQSDPVFQAAQLTSMIDSDFSKGGTVFKNFEALSSGHKIVLLTLTRLVEKVEEKTLVLIDEPEAHLHPPLLSAMTRAISKLMTKRNGVAIVATHSPVILQEVPRSCVWVLDRILTASKAERPTIETFAENVGILSREVFKLELSQSGYHQILDSLRHKYTDYKRALSELGGQLGAEGKAILKGMYLE